jgi:putative membrane protein
MAFYNSAGGRFQMNVKLIIGLILIALTMIFIIQNVEVVQIRFLFWTLTISRALLLFIVLVMGIAVGWLFHAQSSRRRRA